MEESHEAGELAQDGEPVVTSTRRILEVQSAGGESLELAQEGERCVVLDGARWPEAELRSFLGDALESYTRAQTNLEAAMEAERRRFTEAWERYAGQKRFVDAVAGELAQVLVEGADLPAMASLTRSLLFAERHAVVIAAFGDDAEIPY